MNAAVKQGSTSQYRALLGFRVVRLTSKKTLQDPGKVLRGSQVRQCSGQTVFSPLLGFFFFSLVSEPAVGSVTGGLWFHRHMLRIMCQVRAVCLIKLISLLSAKKKMSASFLHAGFFMAWSTIPVCSGTRPNAYLLVMAMDYFIVFCLWSTLIAFLLHCEPRTVIFPLGFKHLFSWVVPFDRN